MSDATTSRVVQATEGLGLVASSAAEGFATGRSHNIAVVTPCANCWFYGGSIRGVESALFATGYDLTLYWLTGGPDERTALFDHFLVREGVDAVNAVTLFINDDRNQRLRCPGKPIVGIGGKFRTPPLSLPTRGDGTTRQRSSDRAGTPSTHAHRWRPGEVTRPRSEHKQTDWNSPGTQSRRSCSRLHFHGRRLRYFQWFPPHESSACVFQKTSQ